MTTSHYLLFYDAAPDYLERRAPLRDRHLEHAWRAHARGDLVLGGAYADPVDGAVLLFRGRNSGIAEAFARADPYVTEGLVERWWVRPWTTVVGREAATPVRSVSDGSSGEDGDPLAGCPVVTEIPIRWGDMDAFDHVNNTRFFQYFEVARMAWFEEVGFGGEGDVGPILHSTECRFRRPLRYPDAVRVGVRTLDLLDDRFTHEYLMVSERLGAVVATGRGVIVSFDYRRNEKAPIPAEVRGRIEALTGGGGRTPGGAIG